MRVDGRIEAFLAVKGRRACGSGAVNTRNVADFGRLTQMKSKQREEAITIKEIALENI